MISHIKAGDHKSVFSIGRYNFRLIDNIRRSRYAGTKNMSVLTFSNPKRTRYAKSVTEVILESNSRRRIHEIVAVLLTWSNLKLPQRPIGGPGTTKLNWRQQCRCGRVEHVLCRNAFGGRVERRDVTFIVSQHTSSSVTSLEILALLLTFLRRLRIVL